MPCQVRQNRMGCFAIDIKCVGDVLRGPFPGTGLPQQQQGLKMRNAVDFIDDKLVDFLSDGFLVHSNRSALASVAGTVRMHMMCREA